MMIYVVISDKTVNKIKNLYIFTNNNYVFIYIRPQNDIFLIFKSANNTVFSAGRSPKKRFVNFNNEIFQM